MGLQETFDICLQNHFTKTEYRKLVPNIPFKDNISLNTDRGRRRPLAEVFVRQGFGDE
jgi:hypothetical protein